MGLIPSGGENLGKPLAKPLPAISPEFIGEKMLCPRCGGGRCTYLQRRIDFKKTGSGDDKKTFKRTDHAAVCPDCNWKGDIY